MIRVSKIFCCLSISLATYLYIAYAGCPPTLNRDMQHIIDVNRKHYQIPGVQISILCPQENVPHDFSSGTTLMQGAQPVKTNTPFQIGSETKSFLAATRS